VEAHSWSSDQTRRYPLPLRNVTNTGQLNGLTHGKAQLNSFPWPDTSDPHPTGQSKRHDAATSTGYLHIRVNQQGKAPNSGQLAAEIV
jgi:hypothetical protein